MNKSIIYILATMLLLSVVTAAPSYTSIITTESETKYGATFTLTTNVSTASILWISASSDYATYAYKSASANGTTFIQTVTNLTPATTYYYKWNGTGDGGDAGTSTSRSFTTDDYIINNAASRTIFNLFTLILMAIVVITEIKVIGVSNPKKLVTVLAASLIGAYIISQWVAAVLAL